MKGATSFGGGGKDDSSAAVSTKNNKPKCMIIDLSFLLFLKSNMFQFMIFVVFLLI
jgi:hypothetical protein